MSQKVRPRGMPTTAAPSSALNKDCNKSNPRNQAGDAPNQLALFGECLFEDDDLTEIRRLPSKHSTWHKARELPSLNGKLQLENHTQQIYIGANPRTCVGDGTKAGDCDGLRCGRCGRCVLLARCVFVDIEKITVDQAQLRLRELNLPIPTLTISSGGGVHFYWRLADPITDLTEWSVLQRDLAHKLDADPAVKDSPRVMRLPGFDNHKYDPARPCVLIAADPNRTYDVEELRIGPAAPPKTQNTFAKGTSTDRAIQEGRRNSVLFLLASKMRALGFSEAGILGALMVENRNRCKPPLDETEVRRIAASAGRYPTGRTVSTKEWIGFPAHLFPEPLRSFTVEGARAMGCDVAYVALPALAAAAAMIGTTRRIQLKKAWCEPAIVWAVIVGYSGTLKSPAQEYALAPLRRLQSKRLREFELAVAKHEQNTMEYEIALKAWKRAKPEDQGAQPKEPFAPQAVRYLVSDATIEALAPILSTNPRGVLLGRDELAAWLGSFERYRSSGKGGDSAQWLEMHRSGFLLVDRKTGTSRTICVPLAGVSIAGTIQPETLQQSLGREHFENGLAARLLLSFPPRARKRWTEADVSDQTVERFSRMLSELLTLQHGGDENGDPIPIDIPLDEAAHQAWVAFYDEHASRQVEVQNGDLAAAFSKLEGYAARFALIFHFIRWAADPTFRRNTVSVDCVSAGVELARWFCDETERIYAHFAMETEPDEDLVKHIRTSGGAISVRDLGRGPRRFREPGVRDRLNALEAAGVGKWERPAPSSKGGCPGEVFRLIDSDDAKTPKQRAES